MVEVGIIIPVYRPTMVIVELLTQISRVLDSYHIYIVDDSENAAAHQFIQQNCLTLGLPVTHIQLAKNAGQQNAVLCGIRAALPHCNTFVTIDDDGQHPVHLIPLLLKSLTASNALSYAIMVQGLSPRKIGSMCRNLLFTVMLRAPRGIKVSSYRAFTHDIADKLSQWQGEFFYFSAVALALKPQPRVQNLIYSAIVRKEGKSGYSFKKLASLYLKILWHYGICKRQRVAKQPYEIERITQTL